MNVTQLKMRRMVNGGEDGLKRNVIHDGSCLGKAVRIKWEAIRRCSRCNIMIRCLKN